MKVTKIETNYKRKMLWYKTTIGSKNNSDKIENQVINIYPGVEYQTILGFGGAFTQSSGYNFIKMNDEKKQKFLNDYFSENGLNYNMGRLPIGSCDFSPEEYSY